MGTSHAEGEALRRLIERFIETAERYRIHSELAGKEPLQITLDMLDARNNLRAALAPEKEKRNMDGSDFGPLVLPSAPLSGPVDASREPVNNGNIYIFCDTVQTGGSESLACIRGAGHNGDHLFSRLVPLTPVKLAAAAVPSSPAPEKK